MQSNGSIYDLGAGLIDNFRCLYLGRRLSDVINVSYTEADAGSKAALVPG